MRMPAIIVLSWPTYAPPHTPDDDDAKYRRADEEPSAPATILTKTPSKIDRKRLSQLLTDAMSGKAGLLALVPGRALFSELGKNIASARTYLRMKEEMDAERGDWHARTDEVAQEWRHMLSKNGEANVAMMDLMHEATIAGADPSKPFDPKSGPEDTQIPRMTIGSEYGTGNGSPLNRGKSEQTGVFSRPDFLFQRQTFCPQPDVGREGRIQLRSYTDNTGILQQYDE